jgi:hypothetical protein
MLNVHSPARFSSVVRRDTPGYSFNSPNRKSPGSSDNLNKPPLLTIGPLAVEINNPLVKDCKLITTKTGDTKVTELIGHRPNGTKCVVVTYGDMKPKMFAHAVR